MAKKRKSKTKRSSAPMSKPKSIPKKLAVGLRVAYELTDQRRWYDALTEFQRLNQQFPNRPEILTELINVCYELNDMSLYLTYIQKLFRVTPKDPDLQYSLAGAYMMNGYILVAYQIYEQFIPRYPDHENIERAKEARDRLRPEVERILAELELSGSDALDIAAEHDRIRAFLERGELREARQAAQRFLKKKPDFIPTLNNLSQAEFVEGLFEQAIKTAQRVLELEPDNYQALANITRYFFLSGQVEEAHIHAERLLPVTSKFPDIWVKKVEAFTYLGDDQQVLDIFAQAELGDQADPTLQAFLYHLAAVATMRQGDEALAKQYWEAALEHEPSFDPAQQNLSDLSRPIGERHAPWPFNLNQWVSQSAVANVQQIVVASDRGDAALERAARRYFKRHPELLTLIPLLLERGDPRGREFAITLVPLIDDPDLLTALHKFALSQYGPDELRHRALQTITEAGLISGGSVKMWLKGKRQEIALMNFEIYFEPIERNYPAEVDTQIQDGYEALAEGRFKKAKDLLEKALQVVPDDPTILNNLAMVYDRMGHKREAQQLIDQMTEQHPDYFFGIIGRANLAIHTDQLDEAEALLQPLLSREMLHISEFRALTMAYMQFYLQKNLPEGAQTWLDMWADMEPYHPEIETWERRVDRHQNKEKSAWRSLFRRDR